MMSRRATVSRSKKKTTVMANKIGSFLANLAAFGIMFSGHWASCELEFIETMLGAIFFELVAIYFNTNK